MRRTLEYARCTQVGIRSLSAEEAAAVPSLPTTIFYDYNMRRDGAWIDRVVDSLSDDVYITIDCDGFDPAIMPAVGTPEPGGLSWYEGLALLRRVIERRRVVGCDIVELCPMPGNVAPNFLCARLIYKILSYRFGRGQARADLLRRRLLQRLELALGVGAERRIGKFLDQTIERLLRVAGAARVAVHAAELHQDAVDRQPAVLALGEFLVRRDRLVELSAARVRGREPEAGRLADERDCRRGRSRADRPCAASPGLPSTTCVEAS